MEDIRNLNFKNIKYGTTDEIYRFSTFFIPYNINLIAYEMF